ncbi:MAG: hypothetical protein AB8F95_06185 [Bacteroidia bacterium]
MEAYDNNPFIEIRVFEEIPPEVESEPQPQFDFQEDFVPKAKKAAQAGVRFAASVAQILHDSSMENKARIAMHQAERREYNKKRYADWEARMQQWAEGCGMDWAANMDWTGGCKSSKKKRY